MRASTARPDLRLRAPVLGRMAGRREVALQMDADDRVPLFLARREEHAVAHEAGVVDEHVEPAERVDRGLHERPRAAPVGDVARVCHGFAAERADLVDDLLRRSGVAARSIGRDTQVVDDDPRTLTGERERMLPTDPAPRAGHDHNAAFADARHEIATTLPTLQARFLANVDIRDRPVLARRGFMAHQSSGDRIPTSFVAVRTGAAPSSVAVIGGTSVGIVGSRDLHHRCRREWPRRGDQSRPPAHHQLERSQPLVVDEMTNTQTTTMALDGPCDTPPVSGVPPAEPVYAPGTCWHRRFHEHDRSGLPLAACGAATLPSTR